MREIGKLVQVLVFGCVTAMAAAQSPAPVEDRSSREQAIQRGQMKAGVSYRDMQQAQYETKLAEQDVLNAQEAHRAAQDRADESKRQLEAATKALAAARTKEAQARKAYREALDAVDKAFQSPPVK
jgi:septal ring factor EnvC (AmiA/AmiB activator)